MITSDMDSSSGSGADALFDVGVIGGAFGVERCRGRGAPVQVQLDEGDSNLVPAGGKCSNRPLSHPRAEGWHLRRARSAPRTTGKDSISMTWIHTEPSKDHTDVLDGTSPTSWYTHPDNRQHIAYIGVDRQIHECHFSYIAPGGFHWEHSVPSAGHIKANANPLGELRPGLTSWYTQLDNRQHIAYVGEDSQIHECHFRYAPGELKWEHSEPSKGHAAVTLGTSPTSWYTPTDHAQHIAYVGDDFKIHECFFRYAPGELQWVHSVPSEGHTKVAINTSPTSWYTQSDNRQHIAYVDDDHLIHECHFAYVPGGLHWEHSEPSAGHAPARFDDSPTSWYTLPDNGQHIAYIGQDSQINECFFRYEPGGFHWEHSEPRLGQAHAMAYTSPTSWYTQSDNRQHIAYVGFNGHSQIHECHFQYEPGGFHWEHSEPSAGHAPVAAGTSPTSWYTPTDNAQHIAYVGTDHQIHECFFRL
ncbi:hypothetical protein IU427_18245 [Nocardia beijingensis]|uniref:hypothetical protein n=1 Tax=Nocardia beijingensis TaxID=95162 RepID=UPI0018949FCA|nr:hypothetical protein [Nocardia beijingensis]MBF6467109.1 hypothetical protein [Nocardia beijingensis]